jgi:uncharacterized protein
VAQAMPQQGDVLERMVEAIVRDADPDRVVLFGSRARGDERADSDYDILIIGPSDLPRHRRTSSLCLQLGGLHVGKDLLWWTPEEAREWANVRSHFVTTALREGRVLYERAA